MKRILLILNFVALCFILKAESPHFFYNFKGNRVYLSLNTRHAFVSIREPLLHLPATFERNNVRVRKLQSDRSDQKQFQGRSKARRYYATLSFDQKMSEEQYLAMLSEMRRQNRGVIITPFFKGDNDDDVIGMSNFFYVRLKEEGDTILLRQKIEQTTVMIIEQDPFMPLWYVLSITEASVFNAMEYANLFFESGLFQAAEPDLIFNLLQCANDRYFNSQWGLRNTGQSGGRSGIDIRICDAWQIATGANVTVAIIDHGLELNPFHPDLAANMHPLSFDTETRTSPSRIQGSHGVPVAGIVGAVRNNNVGIAGVAPNSRLMSISDQLSIELSESADGTFNVRQQQNLAAGINWAVLNEADILNLSWGHRLLQGAFIMDAIANAVNNGRVKNGIRLGTVVVASSGNDNASSVIFPAALPNVIAVGAIDHSGVRASLSNFGVNLNVVAPGVNIRTTDRQGDVGINLGENYADFGGTSAAAPHVAGVAALMLSVNPNLTQSQVRNIIESTSRNLPAHPPTETRPNGDWNTHVGHGLIDAHAATFVAAAMAGLIHISGSPIICGNDQRTFSVPNLPQGATVTWSRSSNNIQLSATTGHSINVSRGPSLLAGRMYSGWVRATVSIPGQQPIVLNHHVSVGARPDFRSISTLNSYQAVPPSSEFIDVITYRGLAVTANNPFGVTEGRWESIFLGGATATSIFWDNPVDVNSPVPGARAGITAFFFGNTATINVELENVCGRSDLATVTYFRGHGGWDPWITYSPNPVSGILTVSFAPQENQDVFGRYAASEQVFNIRLLNAHGMIVRQQRTSAATIQFDVSNLPEGTYYLHIEHNGEIEKHQIIVQRN